MVLREGRPGGGGRGREGGVADASVDISWSPSLTRDASCLTLAPASASSFISIFSKVQMSWGLGILVTEEE